MRSIFRVRPEKFIFVFFFIIEFSDFNVDRFFIFIWGIVITSITSVFDGLVCFLLKKEPAWNEFHGSLFFFYRDFFRRHWLSTRQQRIGGGTIFILLYHFYQTFSKAIKDILLCEVSFWNTWTIAQTINIQGLY